MIRFVLSLVLAFLPAPVPARPSVALRVLPMGDSITYGTSSSVGDGWRGMLFLDPPRRIQFVGSQTQPTGLAHEGHGGWRIDELAAQARAWAVAARPDVVLLDAGTNDARQGHTAGQMVADMGRLLDAIRSGSTARIWVAQITVTTACTADQQRQERLFNAALPGLTARYQNVRWVDMTGVPLSLDGIHPANPGYQIMRQRWAAVLS